MKSPLDYSYFSSAVVPYVFALISYLSIKTFYGAYNFPTYTNIFIKDPFTH